MISVVIPTYNRRENLARLLADLHSQEDVAFEVIVVDDNSTDGTRDFVASQYPELVYLRNDTNLGPTGSRNRGIRKARGELILGVDSDVTLPDRRLLAKLDCIFAHLPDFYALALRVLEGDGRTPDAPRWWHPLPIDKFADQCFETDYFSGTAFAFRTQEILKIGAFPEAIFQYHEEIEVAYRFLDAGGAVLHVPELSVLHHPGNRGSGWSDHRMFHDPRSLVLFTVSCYPVVRGLVFMFPRLACTFLRAVASHRVPLYFRALRSAMREAKRRYKQRRPLHRETWRRIAALRHGIQNAADVLKLPALALSGNPPRASAIFTPTVGSSPIR